MAAIDDIKALLVGDGLPAALADTLAAKIAAAGYALAPAGGGTPEAVVAETAVEVRAIAGRPGQFVEAVALGGNGWLLTHVTEPRTPGAPPARVAAGFVPRTAGLDGPFATEA